jgi:hypothetical protein
MTAREVRIRLRATQLWEQAGRPTGRDEEFWLEAELQISLEEQDTRPDPPRVPRRTP